MSQRWGLLAVVASVFVLAACTETVPGAPLALPNTVAVDAGTTRQVLDAARYDVRNVFPLVAATDAGHWPPEVRRHLIGWASVEAENLLVDKENHFTTETVTVDGAGVVRLIGDHASVLVYAWLNAEITTSGAGLQQGVTLLIDMDRVDGAWRTAGVTADPPLDPPVGGHPTPASGNPYAQRDATLATAVSLATRLAEFDGANPDRSFDNWLAVSVEPLTGELKKKRKMYNESRSYYEAISCTLTVDPGSIVASITVRPDEAEVLVVIPTKCDSLGGAVAGSDFLRLRVVRSGDGSWKAAEFAEFAPSPDQFP